MEVCNQDTIEKTAESVVVPDPNENKTERQLRIGEHYMVRRTNNTWRRFFLVCIISIKLL